MQEIRSNISIAVLSADIGFFINPKSIEMKKIIMIILVTVFIASCGPSKVVREARTTMNDEWTLSSITYPGRTGDFNVKLFRDTSASCLEDSDWTFISNNNTGSYQATKPQCSTESRFFTWKVSEMDEQGGDYDLLLKPTDAGGGSNPTNQGFRINLVTLSEDEMIWEHTVNFEGSPFTVRMNFNKK